MVFSACLRCVLAQLGYIPGFLGRKQPTQPLTVRIFLFSRVLVGDSGWRAPGTIRDTKFFSWTLSSTEVSGVFPRQPLSKGPGHALARAFFGSGCLS